jgi:hypothetical protein
LTYGSLIAQLIKDSDGNAEEVNKGLDRIGYNIGMRIIEDFLARTGYGRCNDLRDTAEKIQVNQARTRKQLRMKKIIMTY